MKTLKFILSYLLVSIFMIVIGYAQDTINMIDGEKIVGKVLEIDNANVKYKRNNNLEGPVYVLEISKINSIHYINNDIEEFEISEKAKPSKYLGMNRDEILMEVTKKGNKVFIESKDENAILHASNGIENWGYWKVTKVKSEADFILRFNYVHAGLGDAFGKALFINPENDEVLYETKEVNTMMSWDMNTKRGVINKLIAKEIRPLRLKNDIKK